MLDFQAQPMTYLYMMSDRANMASPWGKQWLWIMAGNQQYERIPDRKCAWCRGDGLRHGDKFHRTKMLFWRRGLKSWPHGKFFGDCDFAGPYKRVGRGNSVGVNQKYWLTPQTIKILFCNKKTGLLDREFSCFDPTFAYESDARMLEFYLLDKTDRPTIIAKNFYTQPPLALRKHLFDLFQIEFYLANSISQGCGQNFTSYYVKA